MKEEDESEKKSFDKQAKKLERKLLEDKAVSEEYEEEVADNLKREEDDSETRPRKRKLKRQ